MVRISGFEPLASTMSTWRSDQLSYTLIMQKTALKKWCRGSGSNRYGKKFPPDFKSDASANSATPAYIILPYLFGGGGRI